MSFEERRYIAPRPYEAQITQAATAYLTGKTRAFLDGGLNKIEDRSYCLTCPAALLCSAAGVEMQREAPDLGHNASRGRRRDALATLEPMGIRTTDDDDASLCFKSIITAMDKGILMQAQNRPTEDDPLEPDSLVWLADRVQSYCSDATGRLKSGQRL